VEGHQPRGRVVRQRTERPLCHQSDKGNPKRCIIPRVNADPPIDAGCVRSCWCYERMGRHVLLTIQYQQSPRCDEDTNVSASAIARPSRLMGLDSRSLVTSGTTGRGNRPSLKNSLASVPGYPPTCDESSRRTTTPHLPSTRTRCRADATPRVMTTESHISVDKPTTRPFGHGRTPSGRIPSGES